MRRQNVRVAELFEGPPRCPSSARSSGSSEGSRVGVAAITPEQLLAQARAAAVDALRRAQAPMASLVPIADDAPASSMDLLGSYGSDSEGGTPVGGAEYDPMAATFDADAEPAAKRQELSAEAFAARPLVVLPPEPAGPADAALTARLAGWRARGYNPTQQIRQNREFANPQILQKVVEYFEIDDVASNYPTDMFDPQAIQARRKDKSASKTEASTTPPPPGDVAAP